MINIERSTRQKKVEVSVILTAYNRPEFLDEAILSVLNQTFVDYEFILVDDGSTDSEIKAICDHYKDQLTYIFRENGGLPAARNTGIVNAKGKYICFLDDDDVWMPQKLQRQVDYFKQIPSSENIGLIFTWSIIIDEKGQEIGRGGTHVRGNIYYDLFYKCLVHAPSSVMIKREVFEKIGLFDEFFRMREDWEFYFRVSKEYNVCSIDEPLIKYRRHSTNLSGSKNIKRSESYEIKVLEKAFQSAAENKEVQKIRNDVMAKFYLKQSAGHFLGNNLEYCRDRFKIASGYEPDAIPLFYKLMYIISFFPGSIRNIAIVTYRFFKPYLTDNMSKHI